MEYKCRLSGPIPIVTRQNFHDGASKGDYVPVGSNAMFEASERRQTLRSILVYTRLPKILTLLLLPLLLVSFKEGMIFRSRGGRTDRERAASCNMVRRADVANCIMARRSGTRTIDIHRRSNWTRLVVGPEGGGEGRRGSLTSRVFLSRRPCVTAPAYKFVPLFSFVNKAVRRGGRGGEKPRQTARGKVRSTVSTCLPTVGV